MRMIVCIKQVPSTNEVRLDPVTKTIIRDGRQSVINPFDTHAIEEAVRLKERLGGEICALSMGIPATERLLRDAVARGVDRAVLLTDRAFAGADTLATSYTLAQGVRHIGDFDLIICGRMAVDGDTAQIGPELSSQLGIAYVTDVCEILEAEPERMVCRRVTDSGHAVTEVRLPALITVTKDINMPGFPSISGIRKSLAVPVESVDAKALGADITRCGLKGSPTQVVRTYTPERSHKAVCLPGTADETAAAVIALYEEVR